MIPLLANVIEFLKFSGIEGGIIGLILGIFIMFVPKLLEWARNWRKDGNEDKAEKRKDLLERLTTMEDIISNQQARHMALHEQLIKEREEAQSEKMRLERQLFDLERRFKILEEKITEYEAVIAASQGSEYDPRD